MCCTLCIFLLLFIHTAPREICPISLKKNKKNDQDDDNNEGEKEKLRGKKKLLAIWAPFTTSLITNWLFQVKSWPPPLPGKQNTIPIYTSNMTVNFERDKYHIHNPFKIHTPFVRQKSNDFQRGMYSPWNSLILYRMMLL